MQLQHTQASGIPSFNKTIVFAMKLNVLRFWCAKKQNDIGDHRTEVSKCFKLL